MRLRPVFSALIAALLFLAASTHAADIYVPDHHPTIQDAINAAADGDTVRVRAGIWVETIDFIGKAITVKSVAGPAVTAINGRKQGPVVTFQNHETPDSVIQGFTLANGSGDNGGGVCCLGSSPSILNNVVYKNLARNSGGGIYTENGSPAIRGNTIIENRAKARGCGIGCGADSEAVIENNIIMGNYQHNVAAGGGIAGYEAAPEIRGNYIVNNTAWDGGGIELFASGSDGAIENNFIAWNTSTETTKYGGGGIYMNFSEPVFTGNIIIGNHSASNGGGLWARQVSHLYGVGTAVPGSAFTIRVVGPPGSSVLLARGSGLLDPPHQSPFGLIYLRPPITKYFLSATLPQGVTNLRTVIPPGSQPGDRYPLQAWLSATRQVTNPFTVEVE